MLVILWIYVPLSHANYLPQWQRSTSVLERGVNSDSHERCIKFHNPDRISNWISFKSRFGSVIIQSGWCIRMLTKSVLIAALGKRASNLLMQRTFSNTQTLRQSIKNHQPNGLEKRLLVWNGKYKSVDEVPAFVGYANKRYIIWYLV